MMPGSHKEMEISKYSLDVRRGVKWKTSMMLPEHVKMLREYGSEVKKEDRPDLNEWDLEAIHDCLKSASVQNSDIKIKMWRDGHFFYNRGTIESIDLTRRTLELEDPFYLYLLKLDEIVDVTIMD